MPIQNLFKTKASDRNMFCTRLIETSAPTVDFYFLVILSTLIVALGLLSDNVILVIGGMLVTPILSPILGIAMGVLINNAKVIMRSVRVFSTASILAFVVSFILGIFSSIEISSISLIAIMKPTLLIFFIAVIAGVAASYTWVKPNLNSTLPGVAITVTLIPPLTAIGLAVAERDWVISIDVLEVLFLNIFGIVAASLFVFALMDFTKCKKKVVEEVIEEEKKIEKEKEKIEKEKEKEL